MALLTGEMIERWGEICILFCDVVLRHVSIFGWSAKMSSVINDGCASESTVCLESFALSRTAGKPGSLVIQASHLIAS